ncbi:MAG: hypothetical protein WBA51_01540 [Erythrobacter sp.]
MTNATGPRPKTPWHLWVVGLLSLIWFSGGANDYVRTKMLDLEYLGAAANSTGVPLEMMIAYFSDWPIWANIGWALGVWGAVAGALLLLLRSRFALHGAIASLIGLTLSTIYTSMSAPPEFQSTVQLVFSVVIWLSVIGFAFYALRMIRAGVLR